MSSLTSPAARVEPRRSPLFPRLRLPRDPAARAALATSLLAIALLPLARLNLPAIAGGRVIYLSAAATGCGLIALLLFEEQLLGGADLRLLGLAGTFLALMAAGILWATAGGPQQVVQTTAGDVSGRLLWHVVLGLGVAISLATPGQVWGQLSGRGRWTPLSYAGVMSIVAALVLAAAVAGSGMAGTDVPPARISSLTGSGAALGWGTLILGGVLLGLTWTRWRRLQPIERWVLSGSGAAMLGLLLALVGGSGASLGSSLGWVETGIGLMITIVALAARLHSGDHQLLMMELSERRVLREVATFVDPRETVDETAQRICRELVRLRGTAIAQVVSLAGSGPAVPVASYPRPPTGYPGVNYGGLPDERSRDLRERARAGPWIERCAEAASRTDDPNLRDYWDAYSRCGIHAFAYAPIRQGNRLLGVLTTATEDPDPDTAAIHLTEILPSVADFAIAASTSLGPLLSSPSSSAGGGAEVVLKVLEEGSFHPVFQPIVEMRSRRVVGYEALTRFSGDLTPDRAFTIATEHNLLERLELATLKRSLRDGGHLVKPDQFLSVNLSPEVLVDSQTQIARLLRQRHFDVVVEITEHRLIDDYERVRQAVHRMSPNTRLAVDDAGAGYASLRHILELRPDFVKLDISLVQGMSGDAAREAMVAGIQHFAECSDCTLIAEGVETEAERTRLVDLGVPLGQGYLFAHPQPLAAFRRSA
ncbi:MAG: EAL domain-containing protein [Candidatus Dormibacteria bacterium]